jgi:hypothetical protein
MQPVRSYEQSKLRIAIVTGLSNPNNCELHEHQFEFLSAIIPRNNSFSGIDFDRDVVHRNFPFVESSLKSGSISPSPRPNLIRASFANSLQFLKCRSTNYRALSTPHWKQLFESTTHLIIITGSCGLQLLDDAVSQLGTPRKLDILALGPVVYRPRAFRSSMRSEITVEAVQGTHDWISRLAYRGNSTLVRGLGHLGYWMNHETRDIACQWLSSKISR